MNWHIINYYHIVLLEANSMVEIQYYFHDFPMCINLVLQFSEFAMVVIFDNTIKELVLEGVNVFEDQTHS